MSARRMRHEIRLEIEETKQKLQQLEQKLQKQDDPDIKEEKQRLEAYLEKLEKEYDSMGVTTKKETVQVISFRGVEEEAPSFLTRIPYLLGSITATITFIYFLYLEQQEKDYLTFLINYFTMKNEQVSIQQWETNMDTNSQILFLLMSVTASLFLIQTIVSLTKKDIYFAGYSLFLAVYFAYPLVVLLMYPQENWLGIIKHHSHYLGIIMILAALFLVLRGSFTKDSLWLSMLTIGDSFILVISEVYVIFNYFMALNFVQLFLDMSWVINTALLIGILGANIAPRK